MHHHSLDKYHRYCYRYSAAMGEEKTEAPGFSESAYGNTSTERAYTLVLPQYISKMDGCVIKLPHTQENMINNAEGK